MQVTQETYRGLECLRLADGELALWLTTEVGLRLIGLRLGDQPDLLADLPGAHIELPDGSSYSLRGGHRLWYAPEVPQTTYHPDDRPVETKTTEEAVEQIQPPDEPTGVRKSWRVAVDGSQPVVEIRHRLANETGRAIRLAPWAITMLRPGGVAVLPQPSTPVDKHGLQPNRSLVLWPYTPLGSRHIEWKDEAILVHAKMKAEALKVGSPNPLGWMAYALDELLFVKRADYQQGARYLDHGASSQIYCSADVIELETLGPEVELAPGASTTHVERWEIYAKAGGPEDVLSMMTGIDAAVT